MTISKFKKFLKENGRAPKTQAVAISTIKSFYSAFDIQLSSSIGKTRKSLPLRENQNFLTKEDIKKMITNAASLRDKAIFLTMVTSGMARQEIVNLRFKDIDYDDNGIGIINIRRQKSQVEFTTFVSPEAVQAIKNYIDERKRIEKLKPNGKNDCIFVTYDFGKKLQLITFSFIFSKLAVTLGYTNGKFLNKIRSHALRKFFASTLENAGMPKNKIDYMLAHTPTGNDLAYFKNDTESLKKLYIKFLPYLTFEKTIEVRSLDTKDAERLEALERENQKLKLEMQGHESLKNQVETMQKDMEKIQKFIELDGLKLLKKQ
ncbi:MAG TPA: tyrosine-type recombinase/integrase [Candidatus Methylomirabilis sp.]|nr:tyrosine-type recombinase/integrase [Candidatus Methylomirabilis sp.]